MALKPDFSKGLVPAILQDTQTKQVLMLGYMNEEAYELTLRDKVCWFYSRSKERLWKKGESSKNYQHVDDIRLNCDQDTILVMVTPDGPTCHTGSTSCFNTEVPFFVDTLEQIVTSRVNSDDEKSYTQYLLKSGVEKITKKFGEEAFEVVIAAMKKDKEELTNETADVLYHLFVLLNACGVSISEVKAVLQSRHQKSGNFKGERQDIEKW
ncbi:bifunctional phosphoribosyl-AMP cyclohydrolase/phosphoribosyl-ATP diphosphatase HisIE [Staphylococcus condimenti]|uniref:Histidine biosynthesis bifunctional protein HisIE n=1 Tax=Staphylococcus condimenti TaxID=70255 RepID=A0AB37H062_9STAP|nr:bifunctional phosphoribosyl-AMP cyclohydrolase/phosphoribosyl-ATP diphosphatase HisIE [Staphylococcus condimenti]AMY05290.1 bifunctional phosphoribosyl-AMP cyclohydrolase/phosphoribosyl-ATP diphosphatase [Staphylococcus condimenti]PNZ58359.1 bifunctional phosphoribosyl-AMP cyclohydrolase/phosphoribosyl-ATP diphosphatase HisIE [Staphylococcus condimenti]QQS82902.1 bifunctional phosphoribosyl-AMP cyclohydrolase/phosphoribosyl-ATP diphosphatase HisIE [Staphylococcus condimenti]VEG64889.1 bifunc